jgi:hypothetical protein
MNVAPPTLIRKPRLQLPVIGGTIERRMLVNFRCDPATLARLLPPPFRLKLVNGWGMAGICLIRLGRLKPAFLPGTVGFTSENAAHRIAVEWDEEGGTREGVFIPRRDTNSALNRLVGGKLFPGEHHAATFSVWETGARFKLEMKSNDGKTSVRIQARPAEKLPANSAFGSLSKASDFFKAGALGWSPRSVDDSFDGLELGCHDWHITPLHVEFVESSFFGNQDLFPAGSAEFDSAFLMRNIQHEWLARGRL